MHVSDGYRSCLMADIKNLADVYSVHFPLANAVYDAKVKFPCIFENGNQLSFQLYPRRLDNNN